MLLLLYETKYKREKLLGANAKWFVGSMIMMKNDVNGRSMKH